MNKKIIFTLSIAFLLLLAAGCSAKPPGCSDAEVIATAELLIYQDIHDDLGVLPGASLHPNQKGQGYFNIRISEIRTAGIDESINKIYCAATLNISPADAVLAVYHKEGIDWPQILRSRITYGAARVNHHGVHEATIYSVQKMDDNQHFYVQFEEGGMDAIIAAKEFAVLTEIIRLNSR
ncbi:hypothetical protein SAMN05421693_11271 [Ectothiorhodospira magna]|uniref:Lipoprotein n=1 Tax=Ectothiorhodospira magna TaxID=867345 RepID=A0A1H9C6J8_9GAMM|nr:hypothetical protein [Ectothiorhodospira magna]SEP96744.1 hypothetical protein SAMN05421693_11271 [Ectothiorhodospira magna]